VGHRTVLDDDLRDLRGQALAGTQVEGDALPAPVVHEEFQGDVGLCGGFGGHIRLPAVSPDLTAFDRAGTVLAADGELPEPILRDRPDGLEYVGLLVADLVRPERDRRLHGDATENLEQVALDHVSQGTGVVVVAPAVFDADGLGHRDLHVVDVAPVPERLEEGVGEAQGQDVLHRLLAQIVVDAVDLRFHQQAGEGTVQGDGGRQIPAERLLENHAAAMPVGDQPRVAQFPGDALEEGRCRGQVEDVVRPLPFPGEALPEFREGRGIGEVRGEVGHTRGESVPVLPLRLAPARELVQPLSQVSAERLVRHDDAVHPHDSELLGQPPVQEEVVQRRREFPLREITPGPEDDQDGRLGGGRNRRLHSISSGRLGGPRLIYDRGALRKIHAVTLDESGADRTG
jgi:hypothetical protein